MKSRITNITVRSYRSLPPTILVERVYGLRNRIKFFVHFYDLPTPSSFARVQRAQFVLAEKKR